MNFNNPFKKSQPKETDIMELLKQDESTSTPPATPELIQPNLLNPMQVMRQRREVVTALARKFEAVERIPDPAERLLQHKALKEICEELVLQIRGKGASPGMGTLLGGLAAMTAGVVTLNPLLFYGGTIAISVGASKGTFSQPQPKKWSLSPAVVYDCKVLEAVAAKSDAAIKKLVQNEALINLANSPRCEEASAAFPLLRERFIAAAAKDQIMQNNKTLEQARRPRRDGPQP